MPPLLEFCSHACHAWQGPPPQPLQALLCFPDLLQCCVRACLFWLPMAAHGWAGPVPLQVHLRWMASWLSWPTAWAAAPILLMSLRCLCARCALTAYLAAAFPLLASPLSPGTCLHGCFAYPFCSLAAALLQAAPLLVSASPPKKLLALSAQSALLAPDQAAPVSQAFSARNASQP